MERRRSGAALQNVAAIPWLVLRACFLECGQCSAASGTQCKLALGVRNLATEAVALQWSLYGKNWNRIERTASPAES